MSNETILKDIEALAKTLAETAADGLSNKRKTIFYKEILKDIAFQVFEKAQLIEHEQEVAVMHNEEQKTKTQVEPEPVIITPVTPPPAPPVMQAPVAAPEPIIVPEPTPVTPPVVIAEETVPPAPKPQPSKPVQEDQSIYDKLSKNHQKQNLADKHTETPIKDLPKAISISKKFEFINELFSGNPDIYKEIISGIETSGSYDNAVRILEEHVFAKFDWSDNEQLASEFMGLVKRRFI